MENLHRKKLSGLSLTSLVFAAVIATGCGGGDIDVGDFIDYAKAKWDFSLDLDAGGKIDILKLLGI